MLLERSRGVGPGGVAAGGGGGYVAGGGSQSSRSSSSTSSAGRGMISADPLVDGMWLQSQVDTLQWQLRQAESSRHMYRAVLGQVVRFLERAHTSLDAMQKKASNTSKSDSGCRVPRSRSVHTVNASASRPASGDRETLGVQRAKSVTQIGTDAPSTVAAPNAARDYTWRRPRSRLEPEELPPEKLSQEAFRLLRTVHSLLNTREPDLTHRISSPPVSPSPSPSPSSANEATPVLCSTPVQCSTPILSSTPSEEESATVAFRRKLQLSTPTRQYATLPRRLPPPPPPPHTPQPSVSSAEDESGFSSLGSFQEVGVPILSSTANAANGSFHEVGLPRADSSQAPALPPLPPHRRWSSSLPMPPPLCSPVKSGEGLRVLWV